jgi:hypothetical protein
VELARRCWSGVDLAREAKVSPPTVSAALAGKRISAKSLRLIADCLSRVPPIREVEQLLGGEGLGRGDE